MNHNMHINPITFGKYDDLKERQQIFVDALLDDGCSGYTVTRRQVVATAERCGYPGSFPWPSWLTADMTRRIDRGVFSLPELGDRVEARSNNDPALDTLPEGVEYMGQGLMAHDMRYSAICYGEGLTACEAAHNTPEPVAVSPGHETEGDGLADVIEEPVMDDSIAPAEMEASEPALSA